MSFICVWAADWGSIPMERLATGVLRAAPRVSVDSGRGHIWADGKSLELQEICHKIRTALSHLDTIKVRLGVSAIPIAAELAARDGEGDSVIVVPEGKERGFIGGQRSGVRGASPQRMDRFDGGGGGGYGGVAG